MMSAMTNAKMGELEPPPPLMQTTSSKLNYWSLRKTDMNKPLCISKFIAYLPSFYFNNEKNIEIFDFVRNVYFCVLEQL